MPDGSLPGAADAALMSSTTPKASKPVKPATLEQIVALLPKTVQAYTQAAFAFSNIDNCSRFGFQRRMADMEDGLTELALNTPAVDEDDAIALLTVASYSINLIGEHELDREQLAREVCTLRRVFRAALPILAKKAHFQLGCTHAEGFLDYCGVLAGRGEMPA